MAFFGAQSDDPFRQQEQAHGPGNGAGGCMADEKIGGLLGMLQKSGADRGGGIMGLPYPTGGLLAMYEKKPQPVYRSVNGSDAVDRMLSREDPSRRFRVYRRNIGSDKNGGTRGSSGRFAHWLFISEDGKHGFGFNQDGEEIELPSSLDGYKLHPDFADKVFSANGLSAARTIRKNKFEEAKKFVPKHPYHNPPTDYYNDYNTYDFFLNNCQDYVKDLVRYYKDTPNKDIH